jgi:hypothetical protein
LQPSSQPDPLPFQVQSFGGRAFVPGAGAGAGTSHAQFQSTSGSSSNGSGSGSSFPFSSPASASPSPSPLLSSPSAPRSPYLAILARKLWGCITSFEQCGTHASTRVFICAAFCAVVGGSVSRFSHVLVKMMKATTRPGAAAVAAGAAGVGLRLHDAQLPKYIPGAGRRLRGGWECYALAAPVASATWLAGDWPAV